VRIKIWRPGRTYEGFAYYCGFYFAPFSNSVSNVIFGRESPQQVMYTPCVGSLLDQAGYVFSIKLGTILGTMKCIPRV
jgi:hypothetical protein